MICAALKCVFGGIVYAQLFAFEFYAFNDLPNSLLSHTEPEALLSKNI